MMAGRVTRQARSVTRLIPFPDNLSGLIPKKVTNRAWVGTKRANLGTNPPRAGTNQRREPVVSGLEAGRAGWLSPWVIHRDDARDGPRIDTNKRMSDACSAAGSLPPTSAPMPTPVQQSRRPTSAPVLNRYILFYSSFSSSFFFYLPMGYPSRPHPSTR